MELYPFVEDGVDAGASDAEVGWPLGNAGEALGKVMSKCIEMGL